MFIHQVLNSNNLGTPRRRIVTSQRICFLKALEYIANWPSREDEKVILAPGAHECLWACFLRRDILVLPGRGSVTAGTSQLQAWGITVSPCLLLLLNNPQESGSGELGSELCWGSGSEPMAPARLDCYLPLEATEYFSLLVCWHCRDHLDPGVGCGRGSNSPPGSPGSSLWLGRWHPPL